MFIVYKLWTSLLMLHTYFQMGLPHTINGQLTGTPRTRNERATDTKRAAHGLQTDELRTAHGLGTDKIRAADGHLMSGTRTYPRTGGGLLTLIWAELYHKAAIAAL